MFLTVRGGVVERVLSMTKASISWAASMNASRASYTGSWLFKAFVHISKAFACFGPQRLVQHCPNSSNACSTDVTLRIMPERGDLIITCSKESRIPRNAELSTWFRPYDVFQIFSQMIGQNGNVADDVRSATEAPVSTFPGEESLTSSLA
nr:hypothetical protein [Phyllobacterium sp. 2063]